MSDSLKERYAPIVSEHEREVHGRTVYCLYEDYSQAHALRQKDAVMALEQGRTAVVLKVGCRDRVIAEVHHTGREDDLDLIIVVAAPGTSITPDLHEINQQDGRVGDERITFKPTTVADPLRAGADRELEHPCQCREQHTLDRRVLLERIAMGQRRVIVAEVCAR